MSIYLHTNTHTHAHSIPSYREHKHGLGHLASLLVCLLVGRCDTRVLRTWSCRTLTSLYQRVLSTPSSSACQGELNTTLTYIVFQCPFSLSLSLSLYLTLGSPSLGSGLLCISLFCFFSILFEACLDWIELACTVLHISLRCYAVPFTPRGLFCNFRLWKPSPMGSFSKVDPDTSPCNPVTPSPPPLCWCVLHTCLLSAVRGLVLSVSFRLFSHFLCFVSEAHCEQCLSRLVLRKKEGKDADSGYGSSESDLGGKGGGAKSSESRSRWKAVGFIGPFCGSLCCNVLMLVFLVLVYFLGHIF